MADETTLPNKGILKSKTFWVQVLSVLTALVPAVQQWIKANPVEFLAALAAVNVLVRFATSGKVTLFPSDDDTSGNGSSLGAGAFGGNARGARDDASRFTPSRSAALQWLVGAACAVVFLFTSCTPQQVAAFRDVPITIGIDGEYGTYGYSSKGGLSVQVKAPKVRQEKSTFDIEGVLKREAEAGRYAEPVIPPGRRQRRMVMPQSDQCRVIGDR
jgi:hypothetical protein